MPKILPDGYERVVLFDPRSGSFADVDGHILQAATTPTVALSFFSGADGGDREVERRREMRFATIDGEIADGLVQLRDSCCLFQAVGVGLRRHVQFYEDSPLSLQTARGGPRGHAAEAFKLTASTYYGDYAESHNLLAVLGWAELESWEDPDTNEWYLRRRQGGLVYDYVWDVGITEPSFDAGLSEWSVEQLHSPLLGLPIPGATLQVDANRAAAVVEFFRVDQTTSLGQTSGVGTFEVEVPRNAFFFQFRMGGGSHDAPVLEVADPGRARNLVFVNVCDCEDASATPDEPNPQDLPWMEPSNTRLLAPRPLVCHMDDVLLIEGQIDSWMEPSNITITEGSLDDFDPLACHMDDVEIEYEPNTDPWLEPSNIKIESEEDAGGGADNDPPTIAFAEDTTWSSNQSNRLRIDFADPDGDDLDYVEVLVDNIVGGTVLSWQAEGYNEGTGQWEAIPAQTSGGVGPLRIYNTTPGYSQKRLYVSGIAYPSNSTGDPVFDANATARDSFANQATASLTVTAQ